jgi:hypothetical protein
VDSTNMIGRSCEFRDSGGLIKHGIINNLGQDGSIEISIDDIQKKFFSSDIKLTRF